MTFAVLAVGCLVALPVVVVLKRKADARTRKDAALRKWEQARLRALRRRPAPDVSGFWSENLERRKTVRPPLEQVDDDNTPEGIG